MSYDLHVYTREQASLDIARLTAIMRSLGWEIRVMEGAGSESPVISAGPVPAYGIVFGWDRNLQKAAQLDALFRFGETVNFSAIPEDLQGIFDGCELECEKAEEFTEEWDPASWDPQDWQEFRKRITPEKLRHLREASLRYYLRTSAHVNPFRLIFQTDLGLAIAKETNGLVDDPQEGRYYWAHEVTPAPHTPLERAVEEYHALKRAASPWSGILSVLNAAIQIRELPPAVNTLHWLAMGEGLIRGTGLIYDLLHHLHIDALLWKLASMPFLVIAFGLYRGWRWAWWAMLVGYLAVIGIEVVLSLQHDGFDLIPGVRLVMIGIAVGCLSLRSVRQYFGITQ